MASKEEGDRTSDVICGCSEHLRSDAKNEPFFLYKIILLGDLSLCMRKLHVMGPFHFWQHPCSVSSLLNSSSGCVENGRVAFRNWQRSRSVSSPLDSSSGRVKSGKVVSLAASTPDRLLGIRPQGAAAWVYAPASLPD